MSKPKKVSWADMADEEDAKLNTVISKHGIRVKKPPVVPPPPETPIKKTTQKTSKKDVL